MRQWKIATSLAIVTAIAAPFVFGTWRMQPTSTGWVALTADEKAQIVALMGSTRNCQTTADRLNKFLLGLGSVSPEEKTRRMMSSNDFIKDVDCRMDHDALSKGARFQTYPSALKYLAANSGIVSSVFLGIFALTFIIPALIKRFWRWVNT